MNDPSPGGQIRRVPWIATETWSAIVMMTASSLNSRMVPSGEILPPEGQQRVAGRRGLGGIGVNLAEAGESRSTSIISGRLREPSGPASGPKPLAIQPQREITWAW
jgi:hypothetical protein